MKTLAAMKKRLHPGQRWHTYNHLMKVDMGIRPISKVKSNAVTFTTEKGESYLYFPKASQYKPHEDELGFDVLNDDGTKLLTYRLIE